MKPMSTFLGLVRCCYVDKPIAISSTIFLVSQLEKIIDNQCIKFSFSELMNLCENSIGKLEALYSVGNCDLSLEVGNLLLGLCSKQSKVRDMHANGDIQCFLPENSSRVSQNDAQFSMCGKRVMVKESFFDPLARLVCRNPQILMCDRQQSSYVKSSNVILESAHESRIYVQVKAPSHEIVACEIQAEVQVLQPVVVYTEQCFDDENLCSVLISKPVSPRNLCAQKCVVISDQYEVSRQTCYSEVGKCGIFDKIQSRDKFEMCEKTNTDIIFPNILDSQTTSQVLETVETCSLEKATEIQGSKVLESFCTDIDIQCFESMASNYSESLCDSSEIMTVIHETKAVSTMEICEPQTMVMKAEPLSCRVEICNHNTFDANYVQENSVPVHANDKVQWMHVALVSAVLLCAMTKLDNFPIIKHSKPGIFRATEKRNVWDPGIMFSRFKATPSVRPTIFDPGISLFSEQVKTTPAFWMSVFRWLDWIFEFGKSLLQNGKFSSLCDRCKMESFWPVFDPGIDVSYVSKVKVTGTDSGSGLSDPVSLSHGYGGGKHKYQVFDPGIHFSSVLTTTPKKSRFSVFDRITEILVTVVAVVSVQVQVILMENHVFDPGIPL